MILRWKMLLLFVSIYSLTYAQSGFTTLGGANFLGYGRAGVNVNGIQSIYLNQAGLSNISKSAFDVSLERRFNFEELTTISLAAAKTFGFGTVGLMVSNFGFSEYNEQKLGLAYARKLNNSISIGGQLDLLRYNITQVGSKNLLSFELGMQLKLNKDFSLATHIFSPGAVEVNDGTELTTRFRVGLMYSPSSKVSVMVDLDKVVDRTLEYKLGISYQAVKELQIRIGVNPTIEMYSLGAMVSLQDQYKIATAMGIQQNLGNTPAISLQYQN